MKILAIDSASKTASAAVWRDDRVISLSLADCGLTHSETLQPMVEDTLRRCGESLSGMDAIAVSNGPGSFTGLRIGVAAAKGLAFGAGIPCIGVSTLMALAYGATLWDGLVCASLDARAGGVYAALFRIRDGAVERITPDKAINHDRIAAEFTDGPMLLIGDGAEICYAAMGDSRNILAPPELRRISAAGVAKAAVNSPGVLVSAAELRPEYIRMFQSSNKRVNV